MRARRVTTQVRLKTEWHIRRRCAGQEREDGWVGQPRCLPLLTAMKTCSQHTTAVYSKHVAQSRQLGIMLAWHALSHGLCN